MLRLVSVIMKPAEIPAADRWRSTERYRLKIPWKRVCAGKRNMMEKILVIGSPGAGKSTFARKMRDETGIPLYYLDLLWHRPDRTNVAREEFDTRLAQILEKDRWIIDGNYLRTLKMRMRACDTVFLLDYPMEVCLAGAEERIGKKREDLPWIETEFDEEFRQWILDFPKEQLPVIYEMTEQYRNEKKIIVFRSREEAEDFLNKADYYLHRWRGE